MAFKATILTGRQKVILLACYIIVLLSMCSSAYHTDKLNKENQLLHALVSQLEDSVIETNLRLDKMEAGFEERYEEASKLYEYLEAIIND